MEFAGFLAWVSRLEERSCEIIDLTDEQISRRVEVGPPWPPAPVISLGLLDANDINDGAFLERSRELHQFERERYVRLWTTLRSENAPLRVIENGTLVSVAISFFDELLMSFVTRDWQKSALVVANALVSQMDDRIHQSGDLFFAARLNQLVEDERLEYRGRFPLDLRQSEIRLPSGP
jgi:hypothetical protein